VRCLAAQAGRLCHVHFNDIGREWDWDMLPGSVNLWDLVEMMFYLDRLDWEGWLAYVVLPRDGDPVETMDATIGIVEASLKLLDKLGREQLQGSIDEGTAARTFLQLVRGLL
jgi:xylose isomerase